MRGNSSKALANKLSSQTCFALNIAAPTISAVAPLKCLFDLSLEASSAAHAGAGVGIISRRFT